MDSEQDTLKIVSGNLTINELMEQLKTPLPQLSGFLGIFWDLEEPELVELSQLLSEDSELSVAQTEIINDIKNELKTVISQKRTVSKTESIHLDAMTAEEIIEKLRCKCEVLKTKYMKKKICETKLPPSVETPSKSSVYTLSFDIDHEQEPSKHKQQSSKSALTNRFAVSSHALAPNEELICRQYMSVKEYATGFIDDILHEAEDKVNYLPYDMDLAALLYPEDAEIPVAVTPELAESESVEIFSTVSYLLAKDFTPIAGRELILDTIHTWNLKKSWTYCIDFIAENGDTCADFYIYEVKWSLPTMSYPIPQVTASVFFTFEVSRVKPNFCPVTVTYSFETERYKFTLEDDIQHETFLDNIMVTKLNFFKSIRI